MAVVMRARGDFVAPFAEVLGRVSEEGCALEAGDTILVLRGGHCEPSGGLASYAAVLVEHWPASVPEGARVGRYESLAHLRTGDVVSVEGATGFTRTWYRHGSSDNALFVTEQCDNRCLMCSQPPKEEPNRRLLEVALRVISLVKEDPPRHLGITGGEPTLLGEGLVQLLASLRDHLPDTSITVLSNGRQLKDPAFSDRVAAAFHPGLAFSVPVHGDTADTHDYIAQSQGAFSDTLSGLYNLAERGIRVELRIVLHRISVKRLTQLAEYIYRKLPFAKQVTFMGLENMGYVKKHWELLWEDPVDYGPRLQTAVEHLWRRGMNVSIYNLPLCVLPRPLWGFARQSISAHKQILLEECKTCLVAEHCAGLFQSGIRRHSRGISPVLRLGKATTP